MRVLFLHETPSWTGAARVVAAAALGLARRGWTVTVVCLAESEVEARMAGRGLEVLPMDPDASLAARALALRRIALDRSINLVFCDGVREQRLAAVASRIGGAAVVVRRLRAGERLTTHRTDRVFLRAAPTGHLFTAAAAVGDGVVPRRALPASAADLGVEPSVHDAVRPVARASLGATTGRLVVCAYDERARPRVGAVLRTMALLAPRHPELRLAIVGPGSDAEDVRMHAAALGITRVVSHLGDRTDYLAVLRAADVGWVTAIGDDAAWAYLDLMALRIPVLAERDALAQHYVADGIAGLLLPPDDPAATAATVAQFLARDEHRVAMGNAGRARVAREFTEEAMVDGFAHAAKAAMAAVRGQR
ncbi:MAG TPA: glycosyltransferase [Gemmatimonadaceae bacterium]|nr:glycosyltransferase [Gemmatimonadaceae bacterium]